jgi:hypothetical protein
MQLRVMARVQRSELYRTCNCNFISIQNKQTTHCVGYTPVPCRTGAERVIANRVDDLYAKTARMAGKVIDVTDKTIQIQYDDGEKVAYQLGRRFGVWAGSTIPHNVVTELKKDEKIRAGDIICHNTNFFEKDNLDPNQLVMKFGVLGRVAFLESPHTYEDSCTISPEFAKKLFTTTTHIRTVKVVSEQEIRNAMKVGDAVEVESILCTIENPSAGNSTLFDEEALATLKLLSSAVPKAKAKGIIERIEVIYTGDVEDMSPTLQALVEQSDKDIYRLYRQLGKPAVTGQVDVGHRVEGREMGIDEVAIRYYITSLVDLNSGDKVVFASQMKSVIGDIMAGENTSEDGQPLDATFSYQSIANRIVNSPELIGTVNTLCLEIGRQALLAYKS